MMNLKEVLFADLARQYHFGGRAGKTPSVLGLLANACSPRFAPVVLLRISNWLYLHRLGVVARLVSLANFVVLGLEVAVRSEIGPGLYLPHTQGTVIGSTLVGCDATIYHNVTLGAREIDIGYSAAARPVMGNDVIIGSGAKILGGIVLGDNVRVGTHAVVVDNVAYGHAVVGIPTKAVK